MIPILVLVAASFLQISLPILAVQYEWTVRYAKANPDGYFRTVIVIDDGNEWHFPGPTVRAVIGEIITVMVHNELPTEATSIHWHGQKQRDTPWMDGVQQITQYPILPSQTFNYTFRAAPSGTHLYHSHTGAQYTDGLFGAIIVDDPNDLYKDLPEKIVLINEWYHKTVIDTLDIFTKQRSTNAIYHPRVNFVSGLFNGKGRYNCSLLGVFDNETCIDAPYERIVIDYNKTYRFRFISACTQFTNILSIDQHNLTIVAIDGKYVQPHTVQKLVIEIGQRYDVLVKMNQPSNNYWIRAIPAGTVNEFNAILQYSTASVTTEPSSTPGSGPFEILFNSKPLIPTSVNTYPLRPPIFNKTIMLNVTCDEPTIDKCFINAKQFRLPQTPTLLTMFRKQVAPYNSTNIIDLSHGDTVLIIINNFVKINHPMHLHGHEFRVIGEGLTSETDVVNFDKERDIGVLNYENPPYRDTISLPKNSWLVLGFTADNAGSWLFHCHVSFDMEAGMGIIFNVNNGTIMPPPRDYPVVSGFHEQEPDPIVSNSTANSRIRCWTVMSTYTMITIALNIGYF